MSHAGIITDTDPSNYYVVPLIQGTSQKLSIDLGGKLYNLQLVWCTPSACWIMDIADENDNPLIQGIPLVTGTNLIEQYEYVGITGALLVYSSSHGDNPPSYETLGGTDNLYFWTDQ